MGVEDAADRAAFLDPDEHGATATYTLQGGGDSAINGIFDAAYQEVDTLTSIAIGSSAPQFLCRSADLPGAADEGDTLVVNTTSYKVRILEPDGTGMTTLILEKV